MPGLYPQPTWAFIWGQLAPDNRLSMWLQDADMFFKKKSSSNLCYSLWFAISAFVSHLPNLLKLRQAADCILWKLLITGTIIVMLIT